MRFIRRLIDRSPEIGMGVGGTAGLVGGLALELYGGDFPGRAPYGLPTAVTTMIGSIAGAAAGKIIQGAPDVYRILIRDQPEATRAGLRGAGIGSALAGGIFYYATGDPGATALGAVGLGAPFGFMIGYACEQIRRGLRTRQES